MNANGAYFGLYSLVEQIEKTYIRTWFPSADGDLFKADPPGAQGAQVAAAPGRAAAANDSPAQAGPGASSDLTWLGTDLARYQTAYELKAAADPQAAWSALRELIRVLDAPVSQGGVTDAQLPAALEAVLDVDGVLWYVAAHNLLDNFDSYYSGHNYYLYRSPEDGRFHVLSWDMNESFGVFRSPDAAPVTSSALARIDPFLVAMTPGSGRPLLRRVLGQPRYQADYRAHYRTLLGAVLDLDALTAEAGRLQDLIRESARTDPNPLYSFSLFERSLWEDLAVGGSGGGPGGGGRPVPGLLLLARLRSEWLRSRTDMQAPDLVLGQHRRVPEVPYADDAVEVALELRGADRPAALALVVQVDGGVPSVLAMTPRASAFVVSIPPQAANATVRYYARAQLADGRSVFFPAANWTQPWSYAVAGRSLPTGLMGNLVLNELQADNGATIADPTGEFDDWVELHNRGTEPVQLGHYYLSDDPTDPHKHALPSMDLAPGAFLLVWCDSDPDQGPQHAPFKLAKEGEAIYLSTDTETVDQVTFGPQATDHSYGRLPGAGALWVDCDTPSPGAPNLCREGVRPSPSPTSPTVPTPAPSDLPGPTTPPTERPAGWHSRLYLPLAAASS
jgi:hypothetical protein